MFIKVHFIIVLTGFKAFQATSVKKKKKSRVFRHTYILNLSFFFFYTCVGKKDCLELRYYTPSSGAEQTKANINETPQ